MGVTEVGWGEEYSISHSTLLFYAAIQDIYTP